MGKALVCTSHIEIERQIQSSLRQQYAHKDRTSLVQERAPQPLFLLQLRQTVGFKIRSHGVSGGGGKGGEGTRENEQDFDRYVCV